jgi:molecular chaperone Hsp33
VALQHGNIAHDLAHYYLTSEQIPTAFNLSIQFTPEGEVAGAGGLFLQVMPDAEDATAAELEKIVYGLPSLGEVCAGGEDLDRFLQTHFAALDPVLLDKPRVEFFCRCRREAVGRLLRSLPREELADIRDKGPFPVELRCHHCNTTYHFEREEVGDLYRQRYGEE